MSAEDWLLAAKVEEQRLLSELAKTDLFKQLEAVRAVIAAYQGKVAAPEPVSGLAPERGSDPNRIWKVAS
jgi:hypothetical protein